MQTKPTKKPLIILLLVLVLLGGGAAALVQSGYLQGSFPGGGGRGSTGPVDDGRGVIDGKNESEYVATLASNVATYADNAAAYLADAKTAAIAGDSDGLESAQTNAQTAATRAETALDTIQEYVDITEANYNLAKDTTASALADMSIAETAVLEAKASLDAKTQRNDWSNLYEADEAYQSCKAQYDGIMELTECSDEETRYNSLYMNACNDIYVGTCTVGFTWDFPTTYADAKDLYEAWQAAKAESSSKTSTYDNANANLTEERSYYDAAIASQKEAVASAEAAQSSADAAAKYEILTCTNLAVEPNEYEMLSTDTEAEFTFTVEITAGEKGSSLDLGDIEIKPLDAPTFNGLNSLLAIGTSTRTIDLSSPSIIDSELSGTYKYWSGTLVLEVHSQDGTVTYDGKTDTSFEIDLTKVDTLSFEFTGGQAGDSIDIYIDGQKLKCNETIKITQEEAIVTEPDPIVTEPDPIVTEPDPIVTEPDPIVTEPVVTEPEPTAPPALDSDADGLTDREELTIHLTDPKDSDSDNDTYSDGAEITAGTDPVDAKDYPGVSTNTTTTTTTTSTTVPKLTRDIILSKDYTCTDSFTDNDGEWHEDITCRAQKVGWVKGYSTLTFGPNGDITRAEYVKVLTKIFGLDEDDGYSGTVGFTDVASTDWYFPYVNLAENADWIRTRDSGYKFNPNVAITRADAILWAIRAADQSTYSYDVEATFSDVENEDYFAYALSIANSTLVDTADDTDQPIVEGYTNGTFGPYKNIARSEAMAIATRIAIAWGVASEDWDD